MKGLGPWAAGLLLVGVSLGAFGSHALKARLSSEHLAVYETAVLYHLIHALGLLIIAVLHQYAPTNGLHFSAIFLSMGIILFSGSLYFYVLSGSRVFMMLTPLGGLCFMLGWAVLIFAWPRG